MQTDPIRDAVRQLRSTLTPRPTAAWPGTASTEWLWGARADESPPDRASEDLAQRVAALTPGQLAATADGLGQRRALYPLVLLALAFEAAAGSATRAAWTAPLGALADGVDRPAAAAGRLWWARLRWAGGHADAAVDALRQAVAGQDDAGRLHSLDVSTNLDTFVYDELAALHALGALTARLPEPEARAAAAAAARCAAYHVANTQPDNTTHEPWGLAVFAVRAATAPFAEQQLHDARTLVARRAGPAPGLLAGLLADADWQLADGRLRRRSAGL
jgi:hypothetical protein